MTNPLPISAIVIFRDEASLLEGCLRGVRSWCDEVIAIDMASSDGSRAIAARYADRLLEVDPFPIAEPTRVAAARLARHDWILLIDPDEHVDPSLPPIIRRQLQEHPDAAAFQLPWLFHFKREPMPGTVWGGAHRTKRMLIHRERCELLPYCNRIVEPREGYREVRIAAEGDAVVRHFWSDSYRALLRRHVLRYPRLDAARMAEEGTTFSLRRATTKPVRAFCRSLRDHDGWRMGARGFALSAIFGLYTAAYEWALLGARRPAESPQSAALPTLRELPLEHTAGRRRAA